jgi:hypothetical protein
MYIGRTRPIQQKRSVLCFRTKDRSARVDIDGIPSIAAVYRSSWAGGTCHGVAKEVFREFKKTIGGTRLD